MSDKNKLDDEIEQELEERLEDGQGITEGEDDFTVKVHREDYTVKRRFYDKEKALETADSLRLDKENVVEDNIDHDFVTLVEEEDDVDWDKLVDGGLNFYPPISDAADRKLDNASNVAEELAAESARVGSELDKTMTMSSKIKIDYPKIEPKVKEPEIKEEKATGILDSEIEVDDLGDVEIDIDVTDDAEIDEDVIDEEIELSVKKKHEKTGGFVKKIAGLLVILGVAAGLYFYGTKLIKELDTMPVVQEETVAQKTAVQPEKPPVSAVPLIPALKAESEKVAEQADPATIDVVQEPMQPETKIPEITQLYPYTIHISSYKSQEKASSEVARIRKKGYNAFSAFIEIPGKGIWRRIYAGYFETYTEATEAAKELKRKLREDAIVAKTFFGVQLGSVAEKKNLVDLEERLKAKGYSLYYIPVGTDEKYTRLFSGAYKNEAGAKGLLNKLLEDGFDAKIVKR